MNHSAATPRAALLARARQHFAAIAAGGLVLTGGLTAYTATQHSANAATSPSTSSLPTSNQGSTGNSQGSTGGQQTSPGSGLRAPSSNSRSDAGSHAS